MLWLVRSLFGARNIKVDEPTTNSIGRDFFQPTLWSVVAIAMEHRRPPLLCIVSLQPASHHPLCLPQRYLIQLGSDFEHFKTAGILPGFIHNVKTVSDTALGHHHRRSHPTNIGGLSFLLHPSATRVFFFEEYSLVSTKDNLKKKVRSGIWQRTGNCMRPWARALSSWSNDWWSPHYHPWSLPGSRWFGLWQKTSLIGVYLCQYCGDIYTLVSSLFPCLCPPAGWEPVLLPPVK